MDIKTALLTTLLLATPRIGGAQEVLPTTREGAQEVLPTTKEAAAAPSASYYEVVVEAQASAAMGDHMPLWLQANRQGLGSLDSLSGYVRVGAFRRMAPAGERRWDWAAGADIVAGRGLGAQVLVHQAYAQLRWLRGSLTLGAKEQRAELKDNELSTGAQTLGINARPAPGARLALDSYWPLPLTAGWAAVKGHVFYGLRTDDGWQRDFAGEQGKRTEHTKLHTKAGYLRIGREDRPLTVELGLEMGSEYGGRSHAPTALDGSYRWTANEDGLKGAWGALIPGGGETTETLYRNASGNHVGSWLARMSYKRPAWAVAVYADHFFEDHSSMFLLDYNGYGTGSEWNEWQERRWFLYDLKDALVGVELRLPRLAAMNRVVAEYVYSKYQSGPLYHDHTPTISDHVCGQDDYYNHSLYTGWQHWGQVMGNPLYRSPLYNDDGEIGVKDNRFWAWHVAVAGDPLREMHYRIMTTLQRGWGTYAAPLTDPGYNLSLLLEGEYRFRNGAQWSVGGAIGMDFGSLLGDQIGAQLTLRKRLISR